MPCMLCALRSVQTHRDDFASVNNHADSRAIVTLCRHAILRDAVERHVGLVHKARQACSEQSARRAYLDVAALVALAHVNKHSRTTQQNRSFVRDRTNVCTHA